MHAELIGSWSPWFLLMVPEPLALKASYFFFFFNTFSGLFAAGVLVASVKKCFEEESF